MHSLHLTFQLAVQTAFAFLLILTAIHKISDIGKFNAVVSGYSIVPSSMQSLFVLVLPIIELIVAYLLIAEVFSLIDSSLGVYSALLLMMTYTTALAAAYISGQVLQDCGCGSRTVAGPMRQWPLLRNVGLMVLLLWLALSPPVALDNSIPSAQVVSLSLVLTLIYWIVDV